MSAKFLHSLSDENPDLQKQIGCMSGIFQLFERHHFLSGRRIDQKRLPPGQKDNHGMKSTSASPRPTAKNVKKAMKEKQRISIESSRTSFSSSSCSSGFSSTDCNKQSQQEPTPYGQTNLLGTPNQDFPIYQLKDSLQLSRHSVDIRNVVKDSMYREARELSIKTPTKENARGQTLKYMDSPRPLQQPKPVKSRVPGLKEEYRVLGKMREAPRKSSEQQDGFPIKDAPRFSYDSRESREAFKSIVKIKELPRLSLDSRESSMRGSTTEMKSNYLLGDLHRGNKSFNSILNQQQEPGSCNRPSSVVAKLMGLETFPDCVLNNANQLGQTKSSSDVECDSFKQKSRTDYKQKRVAGSPKNSTKETDSPRVKNADSVKKPIASCKISVEAAPWRQLSQTPASKSQENLTNAPNSSLSVYGQIEKRLAQLEFKKSGKDLRALKQILEAMQKTKEMLDSRKDDHAPTFVLSTGNNGSVDQSSTLANSKYLKSINPTSTIIKGTSSPKSKSPIVIMKATKSIEKASNSATSVILPENLSGLQRLHIGESSDSRKESADKQTSKDPTRRNIQQRDFSCRQLHPINKNANAKTFRLAPTSKNPHPTAGKSKSGKSFEPMNPRLQQKKHEMERQSHSTTPSSDLSRIRKQSIEPSSPQRKARQNTSHMRRSDDQMSDISSDARDLSHHGDASSLQSESNLSTASNVEIEVTSIDRADQINSALFQQHGQKDPAPRYNEDRSMAEPARAGPEQPSPVSVLDATFYRDEPLSPVKKILHPFRDVETVECSEAEWSLGDINPLSHCRKSSFTSEDYRQVENTKHLDPNLMYINPGHEKSIIDEIAPIYDSTNPDHKYVSEILLASGLLRDFETSIMTIQLHPSGNLINPNLFFVLEQTKASTRLLSDEHKVMRVTCSITAAERAQRKLIFDAVNEILVEKIVSARSSKKCFSLSKWANKGPRRLQLLRDLCSEVDSLQVNNSNCSLDDEDDNLRREDLMHGSMHWTGYESEIPWIVLDVERLIFKDLITEIVHYETTCPQGQPGRHCRQLFSK